MSRLSFNEVVFLDDFFRSEHNGLQYYPYNRKFLRALFSTACQSLRLTVREEFPESNGGDIPVGKLMSLLKLPATREGWAAAAIADLRPALEELEVLRLGKQSLVIGWGLPPSLLNYVDSCGATFIDVEVHPLRFSRHLRLGVRTNHTRIAAIFSKIAVPLEVFQYAASGIKALFSRRGEGVLFSRETRVGLFLGQTEVDLALVSSGKLVSPSHVVDIVSNLASKVDVLAVKPHPYQSSTVLLKEILALPNAIRVESNVYALLGASNVEFVAGISSGALMEAEFFGQRKKKLVEQDRNNPEYLPVNCTDWIPVGSEVASVAVMRDIVTQPLIPFFVAFGDRYNSVRTVVDPNLIDRAFENRWGLQLDAAGLRSSPKIALGEDIRFGMGSYYLLGLNCGWHEPEDWGVWSSDETASLVLILDTKNIPIAGEVRISAEGSIYSPAGCTPAEVSVRINGKECRPTDSQAPLASFSCDFEAEKLRSNPLLIIVISTRGAHRPRDVSNSSDDRWLGFGLHSIRAVALDARQDDAVLEENDRLGELQINNACH